MLGEVACIIGENFLGILRKNNYAEFELFCATSVEWKSLHSVGEQSSFVLKIR